MPAEELVLPDRVVLLHIGPHKTGTTAIQSAFHNRRKQLLAQDTRYAGKLRQVYREARTIAGGDNVPGRRSLDMKVWNALVDEVVTAKQPRVVVSSEAFAGADGDVAARVVRELGKGRNLHVVVTLRPLAKILPSQWQQFVQNGRRTSYDKWLAEVLNVKADERIGTFWRRHDHGALVRRWAAAAGPGNLSVVVVDERERTMLMRTFEQLLALAPGTLEPKPSDSNRSMTMAEIELIRQLNLVVHDEPWAKQTYALVMKDGVADSIVLGRRPEPDEEPITTPRWALEKAAEIAGESAGVIRSCGVRVIGDLDSIAAMPGQSAVRPEGAKRPDSLPMEAAALAVIGALRGAGLNPEQEGTKRQILTRGAKLLRERLAGRPVDEPAAKRS